MGHKATREHTEPMSQEADTTIPDKVEDNVEEDKLLDSDDAEEWEDNEFESSSESEIGDGDFDKAEDDGEDGEEPWGIDEYTAEGYAPP